MATFTITTAQNIDELTSKVGGDIFNVDGGYLTIDQDSRYGLNQNTSASLGDITLSATLGGTVEINSTLVRLIPYNSGTGNVPASNTVISKGSSSGKLIGVYSALNVAPTASGSAMPASGYIKIKQWNSVEYSSGALTGISASATGVSTPGWIEIVGDEAGLCTINRLNLFKVRGGYFQLGATTGTRTTTYQIPSNGTLQYHAGVEVETGTGTGVYEFYPCAGSLTALLANVATDSVRGKLCWITSAGLLSFGYDGTNSTGGYIPPSGRNIRIANVFLTNCTTAARTVNVLPNATLATRYEFATTGGGVIDMNTVGVGWYMNINQPFAITLTNTAILTALVATEIASPISWSNVNIGQEAANTQIALTMSLCFAGGTISNCKWTRAAQAASGTYVVSITDASSLVVTNDWAVSLVKAANATTGSYNLIRVSNSSYSTPTLGGGRAFLTTCTNVIFTNTIYYDNPSTTTGTAIPMYAFDIGTNCLRITFDGLTFGGLALVQPYSGILNIGTAGCAYIKLRNLGTAASPLDMGAAYVVDVAWARVTTVMTVTKVAHGLKANDLIALDITSDTAPTVVTTTTATLKTVASAPTADTFTITVTNAGGAAGTCSYYPCMSGALVTLVASAAANVVSIQRCYVPHLRTGLRTGDNSSKNITFESVQGTNWGVQLVPELNAYMKMVTATPSLAGQTSCYGTHWFDHFISNIPVNTSGVSWSRVTTTATITSASHGLRTGDLINVTTTSDAAAIIKGQKTITATTSNAFTFTCLNAGGASGTLTFAPLTGRVAVQMNEATSDTSSQISLSNGSAFTSAGGLYMPVIGHQAIFETPYFVLGHLNFPIGEAVMAGGTLGNYDITYAIDTGSGYSSDKNLAYSRAGGGGSSASTNVTMTSTSGVAAGDYVFGTNIAPNAKVSSITNGTTVVVDIANIGVVSGVLRFNQLPSEANIPSTGFKMKIKLVTSTTNATAITSLYFYTNSTTTTRAYTYPLDVALLGLTGLVSDSEVRVYSGTSPNTSVEIGGIESSGTSFSFSHSSGGVAGYIIIHSLGYVPYQLNLTYSSSDQTIPVSQRIDRTYYNPP